MTTTAIGKELRKIRIDKEERMLDMAARLENSPAFISAVERGTKAPPAGFEEKIINTYNLDASAANALRSAAYQSRSVFTLEAKSPLARDTAGLMARRMDSLSQAELASIFEILKKKDGK